MTVTKISLLLIVGALLWIGAEYAEDRKQPQRHVVPKEAELSTVAGELVAARVVDVKARKNVLAAHYTELDIKSADGIVTVRVGEPHSGRDLDGVSAGKVTAKFDRVDDSKVYALSVAGREIISYGDTAAYKARLVESNSGGTWMGWLVLAIGAAGLWLDRKTASDK